MSWRIADHGFEMTLSPRVPELISQRVRPWLEDWLSRHGQSIATVGSWAVHPGGPRILSAFGEATGLERARSSKRPRASWRASATCRPRRCSSSLTSSAAPGAASTAVRGDRFRARPRRRGGTLLGVSHLKGPEQRWRDLAPAKSGRRPNRGFRQRVPPGGCRPGHWTMPGAGWPPSRLDDPPLGLRGHCRVPPGDRTRKEAGVHDHQNQAQYTATLN